MGFLKKLGKKFNHGKKLGQKLTGSVGKLGKKAGRATENVGKLAILAGGATGQPELVALGGSMVAGGKVAQKGGQIFRDTSKGRLEKAVKGSISLADDVQKQR
mgnify:CR=1 FL=1|tara:strand:+ start:305 stop:613 length:309 start_codon:yes stop_codon:yes gene_type:complete